MNNNEKLEELKKELSELNLNMSNLMSACPNGANNLELQKILSRISHVLYLTFLCLEKQGE